MDLDGKTVIGLIETVTIHGPRGSRDVLARIDTGATKSSMDISLAAELNLGPVVASRLVKSAHGAKLRPMIEVKMDIREKEHKVLFTLADRNHMKYKVLIGQNVLKNGFVINPE